MRHSTAGAVDEANGAADGVDSGLPNDMYGWTIVYVKVTECLPHAVYDSQLFRRTRTPFCLTLTLYDCFILSYSDTKVRVPY